MLFHTHEFFVLLILTIAAYRLFGRARETVLLVSSLVFYFYAGLGMGALFVATVAFNWLCYQRITPGRGAGWLAFAITVNLVNLFTFKYAEFFLSILAELGVGVSATQAWVAETVILPVGISFYTFQVIALLVDSYRAPMPRVSSFKEFLLFKAFFGQLIAGPIMRGRDFLPQLQRLRLPTSEDLATGVVWFSVGLVKKAVIADVLLAPRVDELFATAHSWDTPTAWFLGILFGFQIYFDFSGYCDMAIGLGRFFGLDLTVNFSTPYVSRSPSEFWSRWNITLSRWFGDYVYIPLGGSRVPLGRTVVNLLITMLVSGLWHGAGYTFIVWGALHGVALSGWHVLRGFFPALARAADGPHFRPATFVLWALTTAITVIGWVYFRSASVGEANAVIAAMFGVGGGSARGPIAQYGVIAVLLLIAHFAEWRFWAALPTSIDRALRAWQRIPGPLQAVAATLVLLVMLGVTKEVRGAFIYFQF
jgi:alginate O-acetyltransferase complex protein AlgI